MSGASSPNILQYVVIPLLSALLGGGIILAAIRYLAGWRKNHRGFDIKMDEFIKQNKQLNASLIPYVKRHTLDKEIDVFIKSNYKVCVVLGPAGSGKTRFAQNMLFRNKLFSKYYYVYFNNKNGLFFSSEEFKNNYLINGKRRYVFVFDYYYENYVALNNLLDKAMLSGIHKFIFIERDEGWGKSRILDRPEYPILMEQHNMNYEMLAEVFYNQVLLLNRTELKKNLYQRGLNYAKVIEENIDPNFKRPIFALLIASIYVQNRKFSLESISDKSQLLSAYWYYKYDEDKINSLHINGGGDIGSEFINQLDILLRILLLTSSITKKDIVVEKKESVIFRIEGDSVSTSKFNTLIKTAMPEKFIYNLNIMELKEVMHLFRIVLKNFIKTTKMPSTNFFKITAELDLVVEWVLYDSLGKWKSEEWLSSLSLFLSDAYQENFITFIKRGAPDFPDIIELFTDPSLGNPHKNFVDMVTNIINEAFFAEKYEKYCLILETLMEKVPVIFEPKVYNMIYIDYLNYIKKIYIETGKKELSERLIDLIKI